MKINKKTYQTRFLELYRKETRNGKKSIIY